MRRHEPAPADTLHALGGRIDTLDQYVARLQALTVREAADIAALGRGLGELTTQVRHLTDAATTRTRRHASALPGAGDDGAAAGQGAEDTAGEGAEDAGQAGEPDWLTVTDVESASVWLTNAVAFAAGVLARFPTGVLPACWVLHPVAVTEVVALQRQYQAAYTGEDPAAVSELLARWLPGTTRRVTTLLRPCTEQRAHIDDDGHRYATPHLDPTRVALWWAETHGIDVPAADAFALTPLV